MSTSSGSKGRGVFGGLNIADIARNVKERGEASPFDRAGATAVARPVVPAAEIALSGRTMPLVSREAVLSVDPRRCRPWKFHNRTASWYTRERCADLIDSMPRDGQLEPALARKVEGDPAFDYELIFGMRRRFAAEATNTMLRIRVVDSDDAKCAVLMHVENADRQDITAMERALSFGEQLEAGLFPTQEALALAVGLGAPQVARMLRAAQIFRFAPIANLLPDRAAVPVAGAHELVTLMEKSGAKEVVLQAASNLGRKREEAIAKGTSSVLKQLRASLERSRALPPLRKAYNFGARGQLVVTRNPKGKVTLSFPKGLGAADVETLKTLLEPVLKDLG